MSDIINPAEEYVRGWEEEYGPDEHFSCEFFTGCAYCQTIIYLSCAEYEESTGYHYCNEVCQEKYREQMEEYNGRTKGN